MRSLETGGATAPGLVVFAPTADQRYLLGQELFLRTHHPVTMRRFQNGQAFEVSEAHLLDKLTDGTAEAVGNRVFVLYAAPGSGKSEVMRWLQSQIERQAPERAAVTSRISRTELDVLTITERFKHLLTTDTFSELTHQRWQTVRQKPRTLTKLLILSALERLLESDDEINALYYRLLNAVQPLIERSLGAAGDEVEFSQAELISREVWDQITSESALSIPLDYEQFRQQMVSFFRQHLLEGLDLADTLRRISQSVQARHRLRPILLIDDLVQSLNLFATDLLDYFITLEEGNWDVVLGLTPAAFEASQRGRDLLQRIAYLDTIDDRVEKLWLSDEVGRDSYVLTEANCAQFAARYLAEYHRLNGWSDQPPLYPFNREALVRLYRGLPASKGKARYFLRHLRQILGRTAQGEPLLEVMADYARTEFVARTPDPTLARVGELYGPLVPDQTVRSVELAAGLLAEFGLPPQATSVAVEPLLKLKLHREAINQIVDDEEKAAVRDWLLGREVNRQLLRPLRQGLARLLRRIAPPDVIHRPGIAKPSGLLHWRKPYLEIHPPVCLEGVDPAGEGISVDREIGLLAFDLHRYGTAVGRAVNALEAALAGEAALLPVFWAAADYQQQLATRLEDQLGLSLARLALGLYSWGLVHLAPEAAVGPWSLQPGPAAVHLTSRHEQQVTAWQEWQSLFDDFFKLRENLYDGQRITALGATADLEPLWAAVLALEPERVDKSYRWAKRLFSNALAEWQTIMRQRIELSAPAPLSPKAEAWLVRLSQAESGGLPLAEMSPAVLSELAESAPALYRRLQVRLAD